MIVGTVFLIVLIYTCTYNMSGPIFFVYELGLGIYSVRGCELVFGRGESGGLARILEYCGEGESGVCGRSEFGWSCGD
jgi:hypothetical protein